MAAEEFKALRLGSGLSRYQASVALGVSEPTIARWEVGRTIIPTLKADTIRRILSVEVRP
jgi:DNA-binding transcriptional regulator YiaG